MPAPYGLQPTGFSLKSFDEIKTELELALSTVFGEIDVSPESQFGQLMAAFGEAAALIWQGQQALYSNSDPRTAGGTGLDNLASLINLTRKEATYTEVVVRFTGTNGTNVPATTTRVQIDNGEIFYTLSSGTVSGGFVDITCRAVNIGNIKAFAGTITQLVTPISGITSVTNPADPTVQGQDRENDDRFRARRNLMFQALGLRSAPALKAAMLELDAVTDAYVFENNTDTLDSSGLLPHSIEVVVTGGDDAEIAAEIYRLKASGVQTNGNTTETVNDSEGNPLDINFSRPEEVEIYLTINLKYDPATYIPSVADATVEEAIIEFVNSDIKQGSEVRASRFIPAVFSIPGVLEVSMPLIGLSPSPTLSDTLEFDVREIPVFDTSRITVVATPI